MGRAEPPRHVGPQARRAAGGARGVRVDRDHRAGAPDRGALPPVGDPRAPVRSGPVDDTHGPRAPVARASPDDRPDRAQAQLRCRWREPGRRPCLGAVVQKLAPSTGAMPSAVTLPWAVSHPSAPGGTAPGQNGGWLGAGTDPFLVTGNPNQESFTVAGLSAPGDVPAARLRSRAELSRLLDRTGGPGAGFTGLQGKALDLLLAPAVSTAFDLAREPARVRDKYGRHPHGQSCLLARRLIEAGTRLVTVNWPDDGHAFWDTHGDNFPSLKTRLMPPADTAFAALLDDLTARGLLDETLVVWVGEFGRTPRVENGGRQHWPRCYSAVLAGGGVRGGAVYGASDRIGADPASNPVSPADLTATVYHALGIDPATELQDPAGRPWKVADGIPVRQLFG
nr:DUF1501 domain-containing protein [Gemmata sp. SH-PL17]